MFPQIHRIVQDAPNIDKIRHGKAKNQDVSWSANDPETRSCGAAAVEQMISQEAPAQLVARLHPNPVRVCRDVAQGCFDQSLVTQSRRFAKGPLATKKNILDIQLGECREAQPRQILFGPAANPISRASADRGDNTADLFATHFGKFAAIDRCKSGLRRRPQPFQP